MKGVCPERPSRAEGPLPFPIWKSVLRSIATIADSGLAGKDLSSHPMMETFRPCRDCQPLPAVLNNPAASRSLEASQLPKTDASDSSDASDPKEFSQRGAKTPPRNVCTREPAREMQRSPDTAAHPTPRSTQDRPPAKAGRVPQISPERTSPAPANSRIRTQSC